MYTYIEKRQHCKVPWDEDVDVDDIIFTDIKFTPSGMLTAPCKRKLEQCYRDL